MDIIPAQIEDYCRNHSSPAGKVLDELERQTHLTRLLPQMLSGALQISLLQMLVKIHQPKIILEIGTFTGYSAIAMAQALPSEGLIHTIEMDEELESMIRQFIAKAQVKDKIILHIGEATNVIEFLSEKLDFVFLDADKEGYPEYLDILVPKMNAGGLIVADNVLWSGKVTKSIKLSDAQTLAIDEFNKKVRADTRLENVLIPIRDGLNVVRVK